MKKYKDYRNCNNPREQVFWLYNRLMALEDALYTAKNFSKFQSGKAERPKGWELTDEESDKNE